MASFERTATGALRAYPPDPPDRSVAEGSFAVPHNLDVGTVYRPLLLSMLRRSETFRRQCQRIAHTNDLTVTLQATRSTPPTGVRARTRIVRSGSGLHASIEVLSFTDPVELISHEIEHIIEQLDGVDLASKALITASGVALRANDAFETSRASRVGRAVADEVRRGGG